MTTVHDLAADWSWMEDYSGFRLTEGGAVWEEAEYVGNRLRVGRVAVGGAGLRAVVRYVDPDAPVVEMLARTSL